MPTREPVVAGRFYPGGGEELRSVVAGLVDRQETQEDVIGAVMPHAGYPYSGGVAGATISRVNLTDTVIVMGPSHTGIGERFSIMAEGSWRTPLGQVSIDSELATSILAASDLLREDHVAHIQEHAVEVQLPFLQYLRPDVKLVPIVLAHADGAAYREIGGALAAAIRKSGRPSVIIASGDMTHYESQESAERKDRQAIEAILELDADELLDRVDRLSISMCAYAPAAALIAAAREMGPAEAELVTYRTSGDATGDYGAVVGYAGIIVRKAETSPLVQLAREAVESYVRTGKRFHPEELTPVMREQAGVFVSIHKGHALRGCIGTFEAAEPNVAEEVVTNAISSATHDPRFRPVDSGELSQLVYSVDVLTTPEPVGSTDDLDARKYGVIVERGWRRGLLLPDLEGVDTVAQQIDICRQKAGIAYDEPVSLYRFQVKRYR
jgi:AmmeMemoRadiSam system protein B/AmmeMemoRadiSam system protein A